MALKRIEDLEKFYYAVRRAVELARDLQGAYGEIILDQYVSPCDEGAMLYRMRLFTHCDSCETRVVVFEDLIRMEEECKDHS